MSSHRIRGIRTQWGAWIASTAMVAAVIVAAPVAAAAASTTEADAASAAVADSVVDCAALASGGYCQLTYADYPGQTSITIPESVKRVTVILSGASGGGGSTHGGGAQGGSVIASIDIPDGVPESRLLDVWLGEHGQGWNTGGSGWAESGWGGTGIDGNNGSAGGGASGLAWSESGHDYPLIVAGGGGGGGHESLSGSDDGGVGGTGGKPAGNGLRGTSGGVWGSGGKGGGSGHWGGDQGGGGTDSTTGGGGGGGAGYPHGGSGGEPGTFTYGEYTPASGGGGGGGDSYATEVDVLDYGLAAFGDGKLMIFAGEPERYDCNGFTDPRTLTVPSDVTAYGFIAVGGAGNPGNNDAPEGTGALVSGMLDVTGISTLDYWVGCKGTFHDGAGYGEPGGGGGSGIDSYDGGQGGGATVIASGAPLIAAGGGGGAGGDAACSSYPGDNCGGSGGSGGGVDGTRYPYDGHEGGGHGGDGGKAASHTHDGKLSSNGGPGGDGGDFVGGGGGGGAGYPQGGGGGHHGHLLGGGGGGGGGAGGSYVSTQRVTGGSISASGRMDSGYILLMPVKRITTDLTVTKAVSGDADSFAHGPFTINVDCTLGDTSTLKQTITLAPGGSHTFDKVDSASVCTVTETGTGGASTPAPPQTVTIGTTPKTVTLTNDFAATSFDIAVFSAIDGENGEPAPGVEIPLGKLGVNVQCTFNGEPIVLPSPVTGGQLDFTGDDTWVSGGQKFTVDGVPVGAVCTAKIAAGSGATNTGYAVDGATTADDHATFTLGAQNTSVQVTDVYELAPLTVQKSADGDSPAPPDGTYQGTVACTFQGAEVTLPASASFSLAVGASQLVHNLPIGANCTLTETDAGTAVATAYSPSRTVTITQDPAAAVTITNTFDSGALLLSVGTSGAGAQWANVGYAVNVVCTVDGEVVLDQDVTVTEPSGGWEALDVDGGALCSATETAAGGADNVWYSSSADAAQSASPVSVLVPADGSATLVVDNEFTAAQLRIETAVTGAGAAYAGPTVATVSDCLFNGLPIDVTAGLPSQEVSFPAQGGGGGIPVMVTGASCVVTETDDGGATETGYSAENAEPVEVVPDGGLRVSVQQPVDSTPTTVNIDNRFDLAALSVTKSLAGAAAWASNAPFEVDVQCTFLDAPVVRLGPDGIALLQFASDGSLVPNHGSDALATLSVGSQCHAIERVTGGSTSVSYEPTDASGTQSGTVTVDPDGASIGVTNTFEATTLTTTKVLAGNDAAAHAEDVFHFDTACTFNGKLLSAPPSDPTKSEVFTLVGGASKVFTELPVGAQCNVNEFNDYHATQVTPSRDQSVTLTGQPAALTFTNAFDVTALTVNEVLIGAGAETYGAVQTFQVQVTCVWPNEFNERAELPNGGRFDLAAANNFTVTFEAPVGLVCAVGQDLQMATHQMMPEPVTLLAGEHHALPITSEYLVGPITVSKKAHGVFPKAQEFGFETRCVWPWDASGDIGLPLNGNEAAAFTLKSGQDHTVQALQGAECSVTETESGGALRVVIDAQGTDMAVTGKTATFMIASSAATVAGGTTVGFTNFLPGAIPVTGAEISWALGLAVLLLLGGFGFFFIRRRRRA